MASRERIELKPVAAEVARLNHWLDVAFATNKVEEPVAANLRLCINEVAANLIGYAFNDIPDPSIVIEVELQPQQGKAVIYDNGPYFDFRTWPPHDKPKDLLSARAGGFGIALIKERASQLGYERVGQVNQLTIVCDGLNP